MEEIYHISWMANRDISYRNKILNEGLKSRLQLTKEGIWKANPPINSFEEWRFGCIYFGLKNPSNETTWFSLLVNPDKTLIGNLNLEYSYDAYKESVMTLAEFLNRQSQGQGEHTHPLTAKKLEKAEKIVVPDSFGLAHCNSLGIREIKEYHPEVFVETNTIPFDRIHRHHLIL